MAIKKLKLNEAFPKPGETGGGGDETDENPDQGETDPEHHRAGTQQPQLSAPEASFSQTWGQRSPLQVRDQTRDFHPDTCYLQYVS